MILQSLCDYYTRAKRDATRDLAPYGYAENPISFAAVIDANGRVANLLPVYETVKKKRLSAAMKTPDLGQARTSGVVSNFLWDNPGYVFGVDAKGEAAKKHRAFVELHERLLAEADDPGLKAVLAFVRSWRPEDAQSLPHWDEIIGGQSANIVFRLDGTDCYVHDGEEAMRIWTADLDGGEDTGKGAVAVRGRCLVTGENAAIAKLHRVIKGVYGAQTSGAGLSTYNLDSAESYGKEQNYNAPVGKFAAFAYTTALNSLLADRKRRLLLGDSTLVVWADEPSDAEDFLLLFIEPPQENSPGEAKAGRRKDDEEDGEAGDGRVVDEATANRVRDMLEKLVRGEDASGEMESLNPDAVFHLLCLAPNAARLAIRFHVSETLEVLLRRSALHFSQLRLDVRFAEKPRFPSTYALARELAGRHRKLKDVQRLASDLAEAVVTGRRYPQYLFAMAIDRIRAERDVTYNKAAMLKAIFMRNYGKEISVNLNPNHPDAAYQLGRLFSLLEGVQRKALPGLNAGIRDRFYGAASSTPASVFPLLIKNAQNHIAKAKAGGYDKLIGEVLSHLESFPPHLTLAQQGLFALGYYHQRYSERDEPPAGDSARERQAE